MAQPTRRKDIRVPNLSAQWYTDGSTWSYNFYFTRGVLHLFKEDSSGRIEQMLLEHRDWRRLVGCFGDIHRVFVANQPTCKCHVTREDRNKNNLRYYWIKDLGLEERVLFDLSATTKDSAMELTSHRRSHGERLRIAAKLRAWLTLFKNKASTIDRLFTLSQVWLSLPPDSHITV